MAKAAAAKKPPTKSEILANVSAATNLPKTQVAAVLEAYTAEATKSMGKKTGKKVGQKAKKKQFVDLEGLEVQGLIDRPQTLYILKKSDTTFKDNIDEYDYMKAIVDSTYKEPF